MTHNCPKHEKYLFPCISGCIFAPGGGVLVNPYVQRVQNVYGKGGRVCLRLSYRRPKLTLVSRFVATELRCHLKTLLQFWFDHWKIELTWTQDHSDSISQRSDQNWQSVFKNWHLLIFRNTTDFFLMTSSWAAITSKQRLGTQTNNNFLILNS